MENMYWKKSVGTLIGAIWLYTLAGIAGSVTGFVNGLLSPGGMMGMLASMTGDGGGSAFGLGDLLEYLFPLLVLLGYWLFYSSLSDFMRLQRGDADREAVAKVRKSYILMLIAILVGYLWIPGKIAALVLVIVAYVKMLSGYRSLKRSEIFPEEARLGAGLLFASTVWLLVGYVIGVIPVVGDAIESVIGIVVFFCVLAGWGRIRRGAPVLSEAEAAELERADALPWSEVKKAKVLGSACLFLLGMAVIPLLWSLCSDYGMTEGVGVVWICNEPYSMLQIINFFILVSTLALCGYLRSNRKLELSGSAKTGLLLTACSCLFCWIFNIYMGTQLPWADLYYYSTLPFIRDEVVSWVYPLFALLYFVGAWLFVRRVPVNRWGKIGFLVAIVWMCCGLWEWIRIFTIPSEDGVFWGILWLMLLSWLFLFRNRKQVQ